MQIVLFSDIHGNAAALEAVLAHLRRETTPDMLLVAGDLVAYGPRPAEALALLHDLPDARFVVGNTDLDVVQQQDASAQFTRSQLSTADLAWLEALPFSQTVEVAPGHSLLVVHANPRNLHDHIKPDMSPALLRPLLAGVSQEAIAVGHYHMPFVREFDGYTLVNVASVGMPRDGVPHATYVTLTHARNAWQVAHHRVPFDIQAVARDYAVVGFPDAEGMARKLLTLHY
jgi:putative phosphoesterase